MVCTLLEVLWVHKEKHTVLLTFRKANQFIYLIIYLLTYFVATQLALIQHIMTHTVGLPIKQHTHNIHGASLIILILVNIEFG